MRNRAVAIAGVYETRQARRIPDACTMELMLEAFRGALGLDICDGYGQTETGQVSGNLVGDEVRDGSMGRPLPGFEVRIVDGELEVRRESCPTFFSRYLDGEVFADEWWPTGDVVSEDDDGYLWYEGRRDDLILSSG